MCNEWMYSKKALDCLIVSFLLDPQLLRDISFWLSFLYHLPVEMNPFCGLKTIKIEMGIPLSVLGPTKEWKPLQTGGYLNFQLVLSGHNKL